jgi:hypothetical protein
VYRRFSIIKCQWQTANWTFTKVALIGLRKQPIVTYFSRSFFTRLFMLLPVILLTFDAAILHKFTGCAILQFDVINFCFTAVSTYFVRLFVSVGIIAIVYIIWTATDHEQRDIKEHHKTDK